MATAVETLAAIAPPAEVNGLRAYDRLKRLPSARNCYHHLAGSLGASILSSFTEHGWIIASARPREVTITPAVQTALPEFLDR